MVSMLSIFNLSTGGALDTNKILAVVLVTCVVLYAIVWIIKYVLFKIRIREFEVAMIRFPNYADVRYKMAEVYYGFGDYANAEKYYREALDIYPYNAPVKLKLAMLVYENRGDADEAMRLFAEMRFAVDVEHRTALIIDNYLKANKLYDAFKARYSPSRP